MSDAPLVLPRSALVWGSPSFRPTLVEEIQALGSHHPALHPLLQAGLTQTSAVAEAPLGVHVLSSQEAAGLIHVHLGVFYEGIIAGCSCADDPSPVDTITEHCELLLGIDPGTGKAWLTPCDD